MQCVLISVGEAFGEPDVILDEPLQAELELELELERGAGVKLGSEPDRT